MVLFKILKYKDGKKSLLGFKHMTCGSKHDYGPLPLVLLSFWSKNYKMFYKLKESGARQVRLSVIIKSQIHPETKMD